MQRDHEERRERDQVDQEDQELFCAHQLERDDPEPEIDLEQNIRKPQRSIADDDGGDRDQDRRPDNAYPAGAFGRDGISASVISPLMMAQTMIWLVMPWGRNSDGFTN